MTSANVFNGRLPVRAEFYWSDTNEVSIEEDKQHKHYLCKSLDGIVVGAEHFQQVIFRHSIAPAHSFKLTQKGAVLGALVLTALPAPWVALEGSMSLKPAHETNTIVPALACSAVTALSVRWVIEPQTWSPLFPLTLLEIRYYPALEAIDPIAGPECQLLIHQLIAHARLQNKAFVHLRVRLLDLVSTGHALSALQVPSVAFFSPFLFLLKQLLKTASAPAEFLCWRKDFFRDFGGGLILERSEVKG
jgi:hypothetical protein